MINKIKAIVDIKLKENLPIFVNLNVLMTRIMAPHRINTSNIDPAFSSTKAEEKISRMSDKRRWVYLLWDNFCHWIDFILGNEFRRTLTLTINREASQMRSPPSSESTPSLMSKHWRETFRELIQSWYLSDLSTPVSSMVKHWSRWWRRRSPIQSGPAPDLIVFEL